MTPPASVLASAADSGRIAFPTRTRSSIDARQRGRLMRSERSTATVRRVAIVLVLATLAATLPYAIRDQLALAAGCTSSKYELRVSRAPNRSNSMRLCGRTLRGNVYIFVRPAQGLRRVTFHLDGGFLHVDRSAPWDFAGGSSSTAELTNVTGMGPGRHVIEARARRSDGRRIVISATFNVPAGCRGVDVPPGRGTLNRSASDRAKGTTFCLRGGTYTITSSVAAQDGDAFIGRGRRTTFLVGDGTVQNLFDGEPTAHFFVLSLNIRGADGDGVCAPDCGRAFKPAQGITLRNVRCHHNDNLCIGGGGGFPTVVLNSEIDHNGIVKAFRGVSAGGIKQVSGTMIVRGSRIHDNLGNGLWCDKCDGGLMLIERNVIKDNVRKGINYEISGGHDIDRAIIRRNVIVGNNRERLSTAGGIAIISSQDVEIYGNTFGGNHGAGDERVAVLVWDDDRPFVIANVSIHHNRLRGDRLEGCGLPGVTCVSNS